MNEIKSFDSMSTIQRQIVTAFVLPKVQWVSEDIVSSFTCYRDAVVWAWANRPYRGVNEPDDQAMFSRIAGIHAPHMSRYVSVHSKAPMDMKPDLIPQFENYTGWHAVTQYLMRQSRVSCMEQFMDRKAG